MRKLWLLFLVLSACSGERLYHTAIGWERWRAGMKDKHLQAPGVDIHYLESVPVGDKPQTILLMHGFGANKETWLRFAAYLRPGTRVLAPDMPGFGEDVRDPRLAYDAGSQVARMHAFLSTLGVRRVHLVGNSMGGAIAALYAITYADEVLSLALIDAAGVKGTGQSERSRLLAQGKNPLVVTSEAEYDALLALNFVQVPSIPGPVRSYFVAQSVRHEAMTRKIYQDFTNPPLDLTQRLGEIKARTLVLWGEHDRIIDPGVAEAYLRGIPRTVHAVLKACGHSPQFERPKESAEIYLQFFRGK